MILIEELQVSQLPKGRALEAQAPRLLVVSEVEEDPYLFCITARV
jgi:hypothetical protein